MRLFTKLAKAGKGYNPNRAAGGRFGSGAGGPASKNKKPMHREPQSAAEAAGPQRQTSAQKVLNRLDTHSVGVRTELDMLRSPDRDGMAQGGEKYKVPPEVQKQAAKFDSKIRGLNKKMETAFMDDDADGMVKNAVKLRHTLLEAKKFMQDNMHHVSDATQKFWRNHAQKTYYARKGR